MWSDPFGPFSLLHQQIKQRKGKSTTMIETTLDYEKVLAGRGNEVNLAVRINAPHLASKERKPVAFAICLDRSGSMQGEKFKQALKACTGIVQNLRPDDLFALTTFDDSAEVVLPLQKVSNKNHLIKVIGELHTRGCTNLSGGWSLARDELDKAEPGIPRRMLLLSDGIANVGVTDNESLLSYAGCGLEQKEIRTSCLGFGDHYNEDLMTGMANASSGNFYDVDSAEKLPLVFEAELEGALRIAVQNLRVRVAKEDFCYSWRDLAELKRVPLPDGRRELLVGDLVSEEERSFALSVRVLPIPLGADGSEVASLEGEKILALEFVYDLVGEDELTARREERVIRLSATPNEDEVKVDESVLPIVSAQKTSRAVRKAIEELDRHQHEDALCRLEKMLAELSAFKRPDLVEDSVKAIKSMIENIRSGWYGTRGRKYASYSSRSLGRRSSKEYWSGKEEERPSFKDDQRSNH